MPVFGITIKETATIKEMLQVSEKHPLIRMYFQLSKAFPFTCTTIHNTRYIAGRSNFVITLYLKTDNQSLHF